MIITKTPLRLPLGGGGTDIPEFYERHGGGSWVSAAVDKHIYVAVKPRFERKILLHYSKIEEVSRIDDVKHGFIREALRQFEVEDHVEVSSLADLPSGSGMGSSGAFAVGLLNALSVYTRRPIYNLAESAYNLERNILGRSTGKQDQYTSMMGGCRAYNVSSGGSVSYGEPIDVSGLEPHLSLFYTGLLRDAGEMISRLDIDALVKIRSIGEDSWRALSRGSWDEFGALLGIHWGVKRSLAEGMTNTKLDHVYAQAMRSGASGGKLVGAGGGGFMLFYSPHPEWRSQLVKRMQAMGIPETPIRFESQGSQVIQF
jgi:D-glycero-alpha-D-manno-heptose-7-phosphate kinase